MKKHKRGPERRGHTAESANDINKPECRVGIDRRRHGYISLLDLCRGLDYASLEPVFENCPVINLADGETLIEQGQSNHHLYFVLKGRLDVRLKSIDSPVADIIKVGECTGEMSIIDGQPTSANVTAGMPSIVMAVHEDVFWSQVAASRAAMRNLSRILAERMRRRNDAILHALQQEVRLTQLENELAAAYEIQIGVLPANPVVLSNSHSLDVCGRAAVAKTVGGDFYDAFRLDENRVCLAIGDVSGKGMPAALFMVQAVTLLRVEMHKNAELVTAMSRINSGLCETKISHMFVSLIVGMLDTSTGMLTYVNAGHPPFLVSRSNAPYIPIGTTSGTVAGVFEDTTYEVGELKLAPGDRILFYTDGITEARGPDRSLYGAERLSALLNTSHAIDATGCVDALFDDVLHFMAGTPQSDDITILAVTFQP
jgi:phosphoserine phosphatase RsbU/P